MELKAVLAFVRRSALDKVEDKLHEIGVKGLTMMKVKGHGEYADFFSRNGMIEYVEMMIFTEKTKAEAVTAAIMEAAHTGVPGDGIVAVLPVDKVFHIRTRSEVAPADL